ncbi:MAG: 30S ribosomal protein S11 [bacterium]
MGEEKPHNTEAAARDKAGARTSRVAPEAGPVKKAQKKGSRRSVAFARFYITCSFNNTIITATDEKGDTIAWGTSGGSGFRGTKKGTPFAAQITVNRVAHKVMEMGVKQALILISGPGPGRETAIRAVQTAGIQVVAIKDVTPLPHNGCRPPKARRV